jgi:hypothetical protein
MPLNLSTADARRLLAQGVKETDPERKEKFRSILQNHTSERIKAGMEPYKETEQELGARWDRTKKVFAGLDQYTNPEINPNPVVPGDPEAQRRFAATSNIAYLAQTQGLDPTDAADIYPLLRGRYAQEAFGTKGDPGDEGLYGLIKGAIDKEAKVMEASNAAAGGAFTKSLATKKGDNWTSAYAEWRQENPNLFDREDKKSEKAIMGAFRSAWKEAHADTTVHRKVARTLLSELQVTKDAEGNEIKPELSEDILQTLLNGKPEDRQIVYTILQGAEKGGTIETGAIADIQTTLARSFGNMFGAAGDINMGLHSQRLESLRARLRRGGAIFKTGNDPISLANVSADELGAGSRIDLDADGNAIQRKKVTKAEDIKEITQLVGEAGNYLDVLRELRTLDQQTLNPITPTHFVSRKILHPFLEQAGTVAASIALPSMGLPTAIAEQRIQELRGRGVPLDKATTMGRLSASIEAPIEFLQTMTGLRGAKILGKVAAGTAPAKAFVKNVATTLLVENAQEAVQDATNLLIQGVGSAFSDDMSAPTKEHWKEYLGGRADTFWALLPFGLIGGGSATFNDFKQGKALLRDRRAMVAVGLDRETAVDVATTEDPVMAQAKLRQAYDDGKVGKPDPTAYNEALKGLADAHEDITIDPESGAVTLTDLTTGQSVTFPDIESAHMGREDAREVSAQDNLKAIRAVQKRFENRGQVEYAPDTLKKGESLGTRVDSGETTTEQARQRVQALALEDGHALDHYDNLPFSAFPIHAESFFNEATGRFMVRMGEEGGVKAAIEDSAETVFKNWDIAGYRTIDQYREWISQFQAINRKKFHLLDDVATATKEEVIEAMSSLAVGYAYNKSADYSFDSTLTRILRQLAELWRHATQRGALLISQFEAGVLDSDFHSAIASAAGLDAPARKRMEPVFRKRTAEQVIDDLRSDISIEVSRDTDPDPETVVADADTLRFLDAILVAVGPRADHRKAKKVKGAKPVDDHPVPLPPERADLKPAKVEVVAIPARDSLIQEINRIQDLPYGAQDEARMAEAMTQLVTFEDTKAGDIAKLRADLVAQGFTTKRKFGAEVFTAPKPVKPVEAAPAPGTLTGLKAAGKKAELAAIKDALEQFAKYPDMPSGVPTVPKVADPHNPASLADTVRKYVESNAQADSARPAGQSGQSKTKSERRAEAAALARFAPKLTESVRQRALKAWESQQGGAEHFVHADGSGRIIKVLYEDSLQNNGSVLEYLERIALGNQVLGDDVRVEGTDASGRFVVTSQRWVESKGDPNDATIRKFLEDAGYLPLAENRWFHPATGVLLMDVNSGNLLVTDKGLVPIDVGTVPVQTFRNWIEDQVGKEEIAEPAFFGMLAEEDIDMVVDDRGLLPPAAVVFGSAPTKSGLETIQDAYATAKEKSGSPYNFIPISEVVFASGLSIEDVHKAIKEGIAAGGVQLSIGEPAYASKEVLEASILLRDVKMTLVSAPKLETTLSISRPNNPFIRNGFTKAATTQDALAVMAVHGTPGQRELARHLQKAVPKSTTFNFLPELEYTWPGGRVSTDISGLYYHDTNHIDLAKKYPTSVLSEAMLHEAVHAATASIIHRTLAGDPTVTPEQRAAVTKLEEVRKAFLAWGIHHRIGNIGRKDTRFTEAYAFNSVEFPAWVLTSDLLMNRFNLVASDPEAIIHNKIRELVVTGQITPERGTELEEYAKLLRSMEVAQGESFLGWIIDLIGKLIGATTTPTMEAAFKASMDLLTVQAEVLAAQEVGTTFSIGRPEIEPLLNKATFIKNFNEKVTRHVLGKISAIDDKWSKKVREEELAGRPIKDTAEVTQSLRQLDALLHLIPSQIRAKIGGHIPLSMLRKDASKARLLRAKLEAMERELKIFLKKKEIAKLTTLVEKTRPNNTKGFAKEPKEPKEVDPDAEPKVKKELTPEEIEARAVLAAGKGKVGGHIAEMLDQIGDVLKLSPSEADAKLAEIDKALNDPDLDPKTDVSALESLRFRLSRYGGLSEASYEQVVDVHTEIADMIQTGRIERGQIEFSRLERERLTREAIINPLPIKGTTSNAKAKRREEEGQGFLKRTGRAAKEFADLHMSFGQDLDIAFNGAKGLVKAFLPKVRLSTTRFTDAMIEAGDTFELELGKLWGIERTGALADMRTKRAVDLKLVELHEAKPTGISFDGMDDQVMDQAEMINYTLIYGQERYRKNLESIGYTAEVNEQVEALLSKEAIQLRAWLLDKYKEGYDRLNEVYERINGVKLPKEKNYAPVSFTATDSSTNLLDPFSKERHAEFFAAFLRDRVSHTKAPERNSALSVYWGHTVKAEYYTAWAETIQFLRGTLSHRDTRLAVKANSGTHMDTVLQTWVNVFTNNGHAKAEGHLASGRWFSRVRRTMAITGLAYNISSIMKQLPALVAYGASDLNFREAVTHTIKTLLSAPIGKSGYMEMLQNPIITRRIKGGHSIEARIATRSHGVGPDILSDLLEAGIKPLSYFDAALTAFSATVIQSAHTARLSGDQLNSPEVKAQILRDSINEAVNSTAQPIELMDRSLVEITNQEGISFMLLIFRSEPRQKLALLIRAISELSHGKDVEKNATTIFTVGVIMPSMIYAMGKIFAAQFRGDDEEPTLEDLAASWLAGQWSGVAFFGEAIDAGIALSFGHTAFTRSDNKALTGTVDFISAINKGSLSADLSDPDKFIKSAKVLGNAAAGLLGGNFSALPVGVRIAEQVRGFENPLTGESLKERFEKETKKSATTIEKELWGQETELDYIIRTSTVGDGSRAELIHRSLQRLDDDEARELLRKRWVDMELISATVEKQLKALK